MVLAPNKLGAGVVEAGFVLAPNRLGARVVEAEEAGVVLTPNKVGVGVVEAVEAGVVLTPNKLGAGVVEAEEADVVLTPNKLGAGVVEAEEAGGAVVVDPAVNPKADFDAPESKWGFGGGGEKNKKMLDDEQSLGTGRMETGSQVLTCRSHPEAEGRLRLLLRGVWLVERKAQ